MITLTTNTANHLQLPLNYPPITVNHRLRITVRCTCDSQHEDRLMIQCDECSQWLHAICIGVNNSNIPSQYICPYCYAIVKQLHDW